MSEVFDEYYTLLGIPPAEQPPHHYRLLGLALFEANRDVISNAADARMTYVRSLQTGPRAAITQKILNELSAARVVLLDPAKKVAYDERLTEALSGLPRVEVVQPAGGLTPAAAPQTKTPSFPTANGRRRCQPRHNCVRLPSTPSRI